MYGFEAKGCQVGAEIMKLQIAHLADNGLRRLIGLDFVGVDPCRY